VGDWSGMDSGDYVVAFELHSPDDCPSDFNLESGIEQFESGLFVPGEDPDWFGRSSYPPHVLVLTRDLVRILPHPSAQRSVVAWPIESISSVEAGHMLLKGWLQFVGGGTSYKVPYNTRGLRSVSRFMCRLRQKLLGAPDARRCETGSENSGLDLKFSNALRWELDASESPTAQFFQAPRVVEDPIWVLSRRRYLAGDLLVLSDRRIVWITDRYRGLHSPYGTVTSYAPLRAVRRLDLLRTQERDIVVVRLHAAESWEIPIAHNRLRDAIAFADGFDRDRARVIDIPAQSDGYSG
jgi:hypothetical protein